MLSTFQSLKAFLAEDYLFDHTCNVELFKSGLEFFFCYTNFFGFPEKSSVDGVDILSPLVLKVFELKNEVDDGFVFFYDVFGLRVDLNIDLVEFFNNFINVCIFHFAV